MIISCRDKFDPVRGDEQSGATH